MLWSKPIILYDTILHYRIEDYGSFAKYWQFVRDPGLSVMCTGDKIGLVTVPMNICQTTILWQHAFLDPLLKDMQFGWHLCLLPRQMVVVIKDGLYVCERLIPKKEEAIESTKTYLYRFGYEPDMSIQIHDWRNRSEKVTLSPHYRGFVLQPHQPWYKHVQAIGLTFFGLLSPHITYLLCATLFSLSVGSLYYGHQNYVHDWNRIHILQSWPVIQNSKIRMDRFFELVRLLHEAKAPTGLIKKITVNDKGITIRCSDVFTSDKNADDIKQFLKKYYPHAVSVKAEQDILIQVLTD